MKEIVDILKKKALNASTDMEDGKNEEVKGDNKLDIPINEELEMENGNKTKEEEIELEEVATAIEAQTDNL